MSKDLAALAEERAKLNNELIDAGKSVQASEAKLSETEAKLAEFTEQVNVIQNSITERKEAIVKMLSAMQRIGRTPPPALVTRRDDALAVVRSAMLLANIFPELKYQADNLSRELEGLVTVENGIRDQRDKEKSEAERLAAEQASLDRLLEEKKRAAAQGEAELADTQAVHGRAGADRHGFERADRPARHADRQGRDRSIRRRARRRARFAGAGAATGLGHARQ